MGGVAAARIGPAPRLVGWLLRRGGYAGITMPWRAVWLLPERLADERLIRHELAHVAQIERMGALRFTLRYLWLLARHGYWRHPMEIEARAAEVARPE